MCWNITHLKGQVSGEPALGSLICCGAVRAVLNIAGRVALVSSADICQRIKIKMVTFCSMDLPDIWVISLRKSHAVKSFNYSP